MPKYSRRRIYLAHLESENFEEVILIKEFEWLGSHWIRVKYCDGGEISDMPASSITQILHCKTNVIEAKKKFRLVKKA